MGVELTTNLPSLPTISQAHPDPKRPIAAFVNASLNEENPPKSDSNRVGEGPSRFSAAARLHDLPEHRVVGVSSAVVPHGRPNGFGDRVQAPDQILDRLALEVRDDP